MISEEAVEAAADLVLRMILEKPLVAANPLERELALRQGRLILEAAAPYMLAPLVADLDKWAGRSKPGYYDEAQDDVVQILKPYRS